MVSYSKITIDGVIVKDDSSTDPNQVFKWEYEKQEDVPIKDLVIKAFRTIYDLVNVSPGQVVEVTASEDDITYTRVFYGLVDKVTPEGATYEIICKNEIYELVKKSVNKIYDSNIDSSAGKISAIALDLIETYGEIDGTVEDSGTTVLIEQFKCINTDVYERLQALKKSLDWALYYKDLTRETIFEPKGNTDSGITLTTSDNIVGVPKWDIDTSKMINDLRVDGAMTQTSKTETGRIGTTSGYATTGILLTKTPDNAEIYADSSNPPTTLKIGGSKDGDSTNYYWIDRENKMIMPITAFTNNNYFIINYFWSSPAPIHMTNQLSIDTYGSFEKQITLSDIVSVADAESRATAILEKLSVPFVTGKLLIKSNVDLVIGNLVNVIDNITNQDMDGQYVVNKITLKYPSAVHEIELGDKIYLLGDWQENTEARIKRLEEQFVRNQDLIMELVSIQNSSSTNFKRLTPKYRKVITEAVTGNIWGLGAWNTGAWNANSFGTATDYYVQQYLNSYLEEFVDTDFKDSNSTCTWTTTGSATFTNTQTAISKSIDLLNGTITTATLTADNVTNMGFKLSADGGVNYETVTSGVAHTFSNTGQDLRFKVTATGNATLNSLTITGYH